MSIKYQPNYGFVQTLAPVCDSDASLAFCYVFSSERVWTESDVKQHHISDVDVEEDTIEKWEETDVKSSSGAAASVVAAAPITLTRRQREMLCALHSAHFDEEVPNTRLRAA